MCVPRHRKGAYLLSRVSIPLTMYSVILVNPGSYSALQRCVVTCRWCRITPRRLFAILYEVVHPCSSTAIRVQSGIRYADICSQGVGNHVAHSSMH